MFFKRLVIICNGYAYFIEYELNVYTRIIEI